MANPKFSTDMKTALGDFQPQLGTHPGPVQEHNGHKFLWALFRGRAIAETQVGDHSLNLCTTKDSHLYARKSLSKAFRCAVESFIDTDKKYLQTPLGGNRDDGCTAVTAVLVGQKLFVANVGDSRAVLSRGGKGQLPLFVY